VLNREQVFEADPFATLDSAPARLVQTCSLGGLLLAQAVRDAQIAYARADVPERLGKEIREPINHNAPNPAAFAATGNVEGRRVLIVDDTFTTGARVQSVAASLTTADATVVAPVPIGRVIGTARPEKAAFWRTQRSLTFDFDTCCLE
jgi:orotate phosphoribosyltransferase